MGLGAKIKEALHSDHGDHGDNHESTSSHNMNAPGAYPRDDLPQRHSDGKEYIAPHGSLIGNKEKTGTTTGTTGAASGPASSGIGHNKLHKGGDEYNPSYTGDSNLNPSHQPRDSGVGLDGTSAKDHAGAGQPAYWGDLSQGGGHGNTRDIPERSHLREDATGAPGRNHGATTGHHHDPRHGDQAVGGGVYNSSAGTGRQEQSTAQPGHSAGRVHDPLSSGTKGVPVSGAGNTYDQKTDFRDHGVPTSRNDQTGHGLAGAGAGAGVGAAAGYGAHEVGRHGQSGSGYNNPQQSSGAGNQGAGVPRSSMLDDRHGKGISSYDQPHPSASTGNQGAGVPQSSMLGPEAGVGGFSSHQGVVGSASQPSSQGPEHPSNINTGAGLGSSTSSPTASPGGGGRGHFGPGHEGSKVLHTCQHCGRDNDISQYFSKDVVYRLGQ